MNTRKFYKLLKGAKVVYENETASITINKEGVLIDVYMQDEDTELQFEDCNVVLTEKQKRALENKIKREVEMHKEESEEYDTFSSAFDQYDYEHFENLTHA